LNRRGLSHHANTERTTTIEIARHRLVPVDEQLKRHVARVIQRVDANRLELHSLIA